VQAITTVSIGTAALSFTLQQLIGWPGLLGILTALVVLAGTALFARRQQVDWDGILPISLLAFVGWSTVSVLWSYYQWATLSSVLYQLAFAGLGVFVALTRDMIQIVRAFGDVLRWVLGGSLVVEVLSGVMLDTPIRLLNVRGDILDGGPIQGLAGDSARLGILCLIAGITFCVELLTRSVPLPVSIVSITASVVILLLTQSNVVMAAGFAVVVAALVLTAVRHAPDVVKLPLTWALIALGTIGAGFAVLFRGRILDTFATSDQIANRRSLWELVFQYGAAEHGLAGWGWIGHWRLELVPYSNFYSVRGNDFASAFNAYLDVFFQLGMVGVVAFVVLLCLVLARSWLLAVRQRTVVYLWSALVVVGLIATSITESAVLVEFSWMTLVICVVKCADKLSWRRAFERMRPRVTGPDLPPRG
jgi:hypothetical protein